MAFTSEAEGCLRLHSQTVRESFSAIWWQLSKPSSILQVKHRQKLRSQMQPPAIWKGQKPVAQRMSWATGG